MLEDESNINLEQNITTINELTLENKSKANTKRLRNGSTIYRHLSQLLILIYINILNKVVRISDIY